MKLYAQSATISTGSPTQRITDAYTASAASRREVEQDSLQSDFIKAWLHIFLLLFPIGTALVLYTCDPVRLLLGDKTWQKMDDEHNHPTIAALIQISVLFTFFVAACDVFGFAATINSDYLSYDRNAAFYLSVVTGLLVDFAAFGWVVFVLATSCHWDCKRMWLRWRRQPCKPGNPARIKKLMGTVTVAPFLCLANHLHYIALAWMSDPFHAGSVAIAYVLSFFLFYFVLHQFYARVVLHVDVPPPPPQPEAALTAPSRSPDHHLSVSKQDSAASTAPLSSASPDPVPACRVPFNTQAVIFGLVGVAPLLALYEAAVLLVFVGLSITKTTEDSPSQIYSIYQGTGLLIVALLTYNIVLHPSAFSVPRLVNRLGKQMHISDHVSNWNKLSDEERCAVVLRSVLGSKHRGADGDREDGEVIDLGGGTQGIVDLPAPLFDETAV